MRILLSAYACHPNRGSEASFGWAWLTELSKSNEVWAIIYAGDGQEAAVLDAVAGLREKKNIHILPISVPKFLRNNNVLYRIRYEVWYWKSYQLAKALVETANIDLIHHVSIGSWWAHGYLWKLKVPFILGPVSGGQRVPIPAYTFLRFRDMAVEFRRNLVVLPLLWLWPRSRNGIKKALAVLVANEESANLVNKIRKGRSTLLFSEAAVYAGKGNLKDSDVKGIERGHSFNLLWSGRFIPTKNFDLVLEVVSKLPPSLDWHLRIVGDGSLRKNWERRVQLSGLQDRITFTGWIQYDEMLHLYKWADVFLFPSLREATGTSILEAMVQGLPVIAFNIHGARVVLDSSCGILIDVVNREQMVNDYLNAIVWLHENPEFKKSMGENARAKIKKEYLWEKRGEKMNEIYRGLLEKPNVPIRQEEAR